MDCLGYRSEEQLLAEFCPLARDLDMKSKTCICDFGQDGEDGQGCDVNCSPGESFDVCTLTGAQGEVKVSSMICADREFPEPATQLMLNGAELIVVPNASDWDEVRSAGLLTRACENLEDEEILIAEFDL